MNTPSQEDLSYQMPPQIIADLVEAVPTPAARISPNRQWMLLLEQANLPSIEEVAQEELRLAGLRINPKTNGASRSHYFYSITIKSTLDGTERSITHLPDKPRIENLSWAPDSSTIIFTNTVHDGLELWLANIATAQAKRLTLPIINDAMAGMPHRWLSDSVHILYKSILPYRTAPPKKPLRPHGPIIQMNEGQAKPVRTYQDLLKNKHDEALFDYYSTSQLTLLNTQTGEKQAFSEAGVISSFSASPDGNYILLAYLKKPYSYTVPYSRFAFEVAIYNIKGQKIRPLADIPVSDNIPKGFGAVRNGPRHFTWRGDQAAALYWVETQDGGDPKKEVTVRDKMYMISAPFEEDAEEVLDFKLRYGGVTWGNEELALADEWQWENRQLITSTWKPNQAKDSKKNLFDRSWEDRYNDPGFFETRWNKWGRSVLLTINDGKTLYLRGQGASLEGNRPFVDTFDIASQQTTRLWRSEAPYYEYPLVFLDAKKGIILSRRESNDDRPNYYIRNLQTKQIKAFTQFKNPYEALKGIQKELVKYQRKDGVELTGMLYLPENYSPEKDGTLPVLMWAYPKEFKDKAMAGQVNQSPYEFFRIGWFSPLLWVKLGYAIFDKFSMPIIGEGKAEPNETFIEQLTSGAEAAIDILVKKGVANRQKIAVGGHSYGAFMTANLLAHTDLFAAGIARSGAYNRTLTPFGFQAEERTFWEARAVYLKMSPFNYADKIKTPLLLIHGDADNNSGTYPMQSERFFDALKGHGATARLVKLPHESHSYRAKESIMHTLWEMTQWLEKYVK